MIAAWPTHALRRCWSVLHGGEVVWGPCASDPSRLRENASDAAR